LHYTASGIITPIGGQNCITQPLVSSHLLEVKIALHSLWYHRTDWRSKLHYTASGIITPIGVMIPDAV